MFPQSSGISPQTAAAIVSVVSGNQEQSNASLAAHYTDLAIQQQTVVCELGRQQTIAGAAATFLREMAEKHRAAAAREYEEEQRQRQDAAARAAADAHQQAVNDQISTMQSLMMVPPHVNALEARNELYRQHLIRLGMDPASAALAAGVTGQDQAHVNSPYAQMIVHSGSNTMMIQQNAPMQVQNQVWMNQPHPFAFALNQPSTNNPGTSSSSSSSSPTSSPAGSSTEELPEDPADDDQ